MKNVELIVKLKYDQKPDKPCSSLFTGFIKDKKIYAKKISVVKEDTEKADDTYIVVNLQDTVSLENFDFLKSNCVRMLEVPWNTGLDSSFIFDQKLKEKKEIIATLNKLSEKYL